MEKGESSQRISDEGETSFLIPRGGPIFVPDFVSPLTKVSAFESDVYHELESLKAELVSYPTDFDEEDISVGYLKLYSDEELVAEAMKIAFEDDKEGLKIVKECWMVIHQLQVSPSMAFHLTKVIMEKMLMQTRRRGGEMPKDSYLVKVEYLAKIRQKQEEDKASVKLHSFNFSRVKDNTAALSSGNIESLKYLESSVCSVKVKHSQSGKNGPILYPEVILCVEVYHNKHSWKKTQEFLVLGSQALTELRDKIHCLTDMVMQKADAYDPSGYFLIEEFFCNDTRYPSAINYSEPIFDWLKNCNEEALAKWNSLLSGVGKWRKVPLDNKPISKLPNFRSVDMQKTRFCDLGFRLGSGYLYCHQGDCKHVIVIRDMRLIHPDDVQNRAAYPLLVYQQKTVLKKCSVCRIYKATKVTLDDKLAGENPCYFCDNCYYLLHYSEEGSLLYTEFKVHDYLQDYY